MDSYRDDAPPETRPAPRKPELLKKLGKHLREHPLRWSFCLSVLFVCAFVVLFAWSRVGNATDLAAAACLCAAVMTAISAAIMWS